MIYSRHIPRNSKNPCDTRDSINPTAEEPWRNTSFSSVFAREFHSAFQHTITIFASAKTWKLGERFPELLAANSNFFRQIRLSAVADLRAAGRNYLNYNRYWL